MRRFGARHLLTDRRAHKIRLHTARPHLYLQHHRLSFSTTLRAMSTQTIAVLDESELKDGQLWVVSSRETGSSALADRGSVCQEGSAVRRRQGVAVQARRHRARNVRVLHALRRPARQGCSYGRWTRGMVSARTCCGSMTPADRSCTSVRGTEVSTHPVLRVSCI